MRTTQLNAHLSGVAADEAFDRICDFEAYADLGPTIRSVEVERVDDTTLRSKWDVDFRGGSMRWTEEDIIDRQARVIYFEQVEGNLKHFKGTWTVTPADDGCAVAFWVEFAVGLPSISSFIDPVAEQSIIENLNNVLRGLFGDALTIEKPAAAGSR